MKMYMYTCIHTCIYMCTYVYVHTCMNIECKDFRTSIERVWQMEGRAGQTHKTCKMNISVTVDGFLYRHTLRTPIHTHTWDKIAHPHSSHRLNFLALRWWMASYCRAILSTRVRLYVCSIVCVLREREYDEYAFACMR